MTELRRWQREAIQIWAASRRGIVSVVTGGGKTIFAIAAIRVVWREDPNCRVMVLVPTIALQDQWLVELSEHLGIDARPYRSGRVDTARVIVIVNDSARRIARSLASDGSWFQIVDECHRVATDENHHALLERPVAALGLSATPEREYDDNFSRYLVPTLGPVIYRYSYSDALLDQVLSPFDIHNYRVSVSATEQVDIDAVSRRIGRLLAMSTPIDDPRLRSLLMRRARLVQGVASRIAVTRSLVQRGGSSPVIVFHESTRAADEISRLLEADGRRVSVYHTGRSPQHRRRDLHLFRIGASDVLVCCRALDEGLNVPRAEHAIVAASTASPRQRIQRLGRVLRPHPRKTRAVVSTLYAVESERERLLKESVGLEGVAQVRWFAARSPG